MLLEALVACAGVTPAFELDADAAARQRLIDLTERYCVIYQTLRRPPRISVADAG